ncbi:DUF4390 domain-containing protein [Castellaniella sp.]|uniref:DUF4390 domain-containing protein n=1 Tax=Castellaniella sp. TaxID=1955812 RepID=UPI002AFE7412|nr:DUF4390 domain-containing protein [Castellaniella sp.]
MLRFLITLTFCLLNLLPAAHGREGQVTRIEPQVRQGQLLIDADIDFSLGDDLHDAAQKGVPLYFTVDLQIQQPRWWWFDKTVLDTEQTWRIQFNALTRQWRVSLDDLSLPATTLDEALDLVRHIRSWQVGSAALLTPGVDYEGQLRLRLDTSRLARPFQVDALNSNAWSLTTPWKKFTFSLSADTPRN